MGVAAKVRRERPGRTRGGVSGRPDRESCSVPAPRRCPQLLALVFHRRVAKSVPISQRLPYAVEHNAICVRWRTYVHLFCFYIV
jgi:hypothetical protein